MSNSNILCTRIYHWENGGCAGKFTQHTLATIFSLLFELDAIRELCLAHLILTDRIQQTGWRYL
jgi:hypothetical protein